ncbi:MAG: glycosyltransferase family 2 protein [Planctomycetota bacterium]
MIITLNEEAKIRDCLESVKWANEIIVVDSCSRDKTVEIAREYTSKIHEREFTGFGEQKNFALSKAEGDWILSIDADERVTPELQEEIERILDNPKACGYYMPRKSYFANKWIKHCGWWPDYVLRLFRRDRGHFSDRFVHEAVVVDEPTTKLNNPLEHHPYSSVSELIKKADEYSTLGAQVLVAEGKRCSCCSALSHSTLAFVKTYFLKMGILDSWMGLVIAYSNAVGVFYRYVKCIEMKEQQK